jgi:hypothetical protein
MSETSDNITDELNKLLEIKKCVGKNKACTCKSCSSSSSTEHKKSDDCKCHKCTSISSISSSSLSSSSSTTNAVTGEKSSSAALSENDLLVAVAELRNDYIKMLKIMTSLTKEIKQIQECVSEIQSSTSNKSSSNDDSNNTSDTSSNTNMHSSSTYQEHIDKILSTKLDELSLKVENKIGELNNFVLNTRRIAITKNKPKNC